MPLLGLKAGMVQRVCIYDHVAAHGAVCGHGKCPCKAIQPAGEPATDSAISRAGCDCCPVVDCTLSIYV